MPSRTRFLLAILVAPFASGRMDAWQAPSAAPPAAVKPAAQPAAPRAGTDQAEITAVVVDVVVRDRRGEPVIDLRPEDFEIYEDGVKQEVGSVTLNRTADSTATAPAAPRPAAPGAAPVVAAPMPVVALVFDRLTPDGRAIAHRAALEYVARASGRARVGIFGIDLSLQLHQPFTDDPALLRAAIEGIGRRSTSNFDSGGARAGATARAASTASGAAAAQQGVASGTPAAAGAGQAAGGAAVEAQLAEMQRRMLDTFDALERDQQGYATTNGLLAVVNALRGLPGRKSVVLFSEGLALPPAVITQFKSVIDSANRANVSIYAMDAVGLRTESTTEAAKDAINAAAQRTLQRNPTADVTGAAMTQALERNEDTLRLDPHSGLNELAGETGGLLITNTNDLAGGFRRVDEDMRNYYVLTYVPTNLVYDGKFRTIRVEVKRGALSVASRKGYYAVRSVGTQPVKPFEGPALAMLERTPVPNAFPVLASALRFPAPKTPGLMPVLVSTSGRSITFEPAIDKPNAFRADFSVIVLFRDQSKDVVRKVSQNYQFEGAVERMEAVKQGNVLFYRQVDLPPGVYSMETVVYDALGARASVRYATVEQPQPAPDGVLVSNLVVVTRTEKVPEAERQSDNPFIVGEYLLYPNLGEPIAKAATNELTVFFSAYVAGERKPSAQLALLRNGGVVAEAPLELAAPDANGRIQQVSRLPLASLAVGTYELRISLTAAGKVYQRATSLRLTD